MEVNENAGYLTDRISAARARRLTQVARPRQLQMHVRRCAVGFSAAGENEQVPEGPAWHEMLPRAQHENKRRRTLWLRTVFRPGLDR